MITPENVTTNPRLAGLVRRYHTWVILRDQTNAEHSWQVMRIFDELFGWPNDARLARYVLYHDCGEIVTGDLPYPSKSLNPELKRTISLAETTALKNMGIVIEEITQFDLQRFKLCHMLEMFERGAEELAMGNKFAEPVMMRCEVAAINMTLGWYPEQSSPCNYELNHKVVDHISKMKRLMGLET